MCVLCSLAARMDSLSDCKAIYLILGRLGRAIFFTLFEMEALLPRLGDLFGLMCLEAEGEFCAVMSIITSRGDLMNGM